jgi:hypothetical protein
MEKCVKERGQERAHLTVQNLGGQRVRKFTPIFRVCVQGTHEDTIGLTSTMTL